MKLNAISKYGIILTCIILIIVGLFSWFIKYPETVPAKAKLTGTNAPKPVIAKQNLQLTHLLVKNNQDVHKGTLIGVLETTADYTQILELEKMIIEIENLIQKRNAGEIKDAIQHPFEHLGELQGDYQTFIQAYIPYKNYVLGDYVSKRKSLLEKDINIVYQSRNVLNEQKKLQEKDLGLTQTSIEKNKKLLDEKLISEQEYRELSSQYINKQMSEPQIKSDYISKEAQINAINKELVQIDNEVLTQQSLFQQAVLQLKNKIELWKQSYLLVASSSGKLIFTTFLQVNQNLEAGKVLAHIVPSKSDVYLETIIPQTNFGKVTVQQNVILKFEAFPWQEYGTITGKIAYISPIPTDSGYLAKVILPDDLITNYGKKIPFIEGLVAQSEIVTKDLCLAEILYYDLIKTIRKN